MSRTNRLRRSAGLAAAVAASALVAAPAAAPAATVTAGSLSWTQTAVYELAAPAGTNRTWLGYVTSGAPLANGTATPLAPATGPTVTTASPHGATETYTTVFPGASGTYDASNGTGTVELAGGLEYASPAPPAGHGFTITVEKPQVVLNGLTGQIFASGQGAGTTPAAPYDRSQPLFNLDLSNATVTLRADGSRVLSGIVPSLATAKTAFPQNYAAGSGPDRTPNTYGSFSLTIKTNGGDEGPKGDTGATGATGPAGPAGPAGKATTMTIRSVVAHLAKAPFKGTKSRKVSVLDAKGKTIATGTVKGRTLKVTLADKVTSLSGKVKLKVTGTKTTATVRIPS